MALSNFCASLGRYPGARTIPTGSLQPPCLEGQQSRAVRIQAVPHLPGNSLDYIKFFAIDLVSNGIRRICYVTIKQLHGNSDKIHGQEQILQFK